MFNVVLSEVDCDIACFTETWLTQPESSAVRLDNFKLCTVFCRNIYRDGGCAIFFNQKLDGYVSELNVSKHSREFVFEICGVNICLCNKNIKIYCIL